eukprot:TRINITY_DN2508_c0_g1_i1.p1 TRINITY_DN2508_c0_g1~~TRINITY_DN2508_c0_g1_i1.p1  ORF type:complete len:918 (-),score=147.73 TRINITY_DN2508_c0_g1_i1:27-2780(-)
MSIHDFVRKHEVENVQKLLKKEGKHVLNKRDGYGQTPLHLASGYAFPDLVALLLSKNADVRATDKNGWSALHSAANSGEFGISKMLLEKGADVHQLTQTGTSALHYMVQHTSEGDPAFGMQVLTLMVEKGANVDAQTNYGETPLFQACMRGRVDNVAFLITQGADVNKQARSGETCLHFAARIGHVDVIEHLLKAGADPNISGSFGTCFDVANTSGHSQVVELFNRANVAKGKKLKPDQAPRKIKRRSTGPGRKINENVAKPTGVGYGIAFGIKRGACEATSCACKAYEPEDVDRGGPCECGHFPVKHKNLGKAQLEEAVDADIQSLPVIAAPTSKTVSAPPAVSVATSTTVVSTGTENEPPAEPAKESEDDPSAKVLLANGAASISGSELTFAEELGAGTSARVFKGTYRGKQVAIKVLKPILDVKEMENFKKELDIMRQLQSEHVVRFFGACVDPHVCLVIDFCSRGSLYHVLQLKNANMNWPSAFMLAEGMMRGILALHSWKPTIVHRDLKSLNLLVDENWDVKVCDFGLSRFTDGGNMSTLGKLRGTFAYCAPEVYFGERFSLKSDVYSAGVVLWEIMMRTLTGEYARPYAEYRHLVFDFQIIIQTAKKALRPTIPATCPAPFANLIRRCWDGEADNRPESPEILAELENMKRIYEADSSAWESVRVLQPDIDLTHSLAAIRTRVKAAQVEAVPATTTSSTATATTTIATTTTQNAPHTQNPPAATPSESTEPSPRSSAGSELQTSDTCPQSPPLRKPSKKKKKSDKEREEPSNGDNNSEADSFSTAAEEQQQPSSPAQRGLSVSSNKAITKPRTNSSKTPKHSSAAYPSPPLKSSGSLISATTSSTFNGGSPKEKKPKKDKKGSTFKKRRSTKGSRHIDKKDSSEDPLISPSSSSSSSVPPTTTTTNTPQDS